ncbi:MAG: ATP-binding protein [Desulfatitalea sp.]|nr:ATP-binding protein [Desulfatitalea sp.]NNK02881.1 ATP-binding protein [Desulfatitalea sp.]
MYKRPIFKDIKPRLEAPRNFIQVLAGPRQTGKTTLVRQLSNALDLPCHYASADEPALKGHAWIEQQWEVARLLLSAPGVNQAIIILDEIQKLPGWSETVKRLWDEDTGAGLDLKAIIVGSAPLLLRQGLTESLAGRFEVHPIMHWSYPEMRDAFDFNLDQYLFFGGYPGAAELISEPERWAGYINESLIETTVSRDIMLMVRIDKPVLLRRLFELACAYSGQILSYQKMVGQLQDVGNTTTLAHYLGLLESAGLVAGLQKYAGQTVRKRASSPKLLVMNTGLMNALAYRAFDIARRSPDLWGRITETAVGAYLLNESKGFGIKVNYWAARNRELDFVLTKGDAVLAVEVKSALGKTSLPGIEAFAKEFPNARKLLIGAQGMDLETFFTLPVRSLL